MFYGSNFLKFFCRIYYRVRMAYFKVPADDKSQWLWLLILLDRGCPENNIQYKANNLLRFSFGPILLKISEHCRMKQNWKWQKGQFGILRNQLSSDVASKCFNSVPLAPYFMRIFAISQLSIYTISCKCIFGQIEIYVKYLSRFRSNLFLGKCKYECMGMYLT